MQRAADTETSNHQKICVTADLFQFGVNVVPIHVLFVTFTTTTQREAVLVLKVLQSKHASNVTIEVTLEVKVKVKVGVAARGRVPPPPASSAPTWSTRCIEFGLSD